MLYSSSWPYALSSYHFFPDPVSFPTHPTLCTLKIIIIWNPSIPVCTAQIFLNALSSLGAWSTPQGLHTYRKPALLYQQVKIVNSSMTNNRSFCPLPFTCWDLVWLIFAHILCKLSQPPWFHMCDFPAVSHTIVFL